MIYRGTQDSFSAEAFHKKCDNKGETFILIESELGKIFGGYTHIPWTSPESDWGKHHQDNAKSFLFSLRDDFDFIKLRCMDDIHEVFHLSKSLFSFGWSDLNV